MDPLSVTLAVVTFATAVKDMVELGQKIHESFAKVSKNLRNAQRVAKEIKEMVEEIEAFYEANKDVLDSMKDFGVALECLLDKFRSFERTILPLLPQTDRRGPGLFLRGWWNNNKIEGRILDLESDIVKVIRRYMMSGVMRNEVKLERVHQDTNRGFTDVQNGITQGFEIIRRDISALHMPAAKILPIRSYDASGTATDEFDRNIIMFAQSTPSTSTQMLRTPPAITEDLMTTAYIKLHINIIAMAVEKLSTLPASARNSVAQHSVPRFRLSVVLEPVSMSSRHLQHYIVRQLIGAIDLLETAQIYAISILHAANALNLLSWGLQALGLGPESIVVGKWAITLSRTLVDASGGRQSVLYIGLAFHLLGQSRRYHASGDELQSLQAVKEAYTIVQSLRNHYCGKSNFLMLYSDISLRYIALVVQDTQQSIEMCVEVVQVLGDILNVQAFTPTKSQGRIDKVVKPNSSFFQHLFSSAPPIKAIQSYTCALQMLANYMFIDGQLESALDLAYLAIAVSREVVPIRGPDHKTLLAWALSSLVQSETASCVPAEELVNMAEECVELFRELAEKNPLHYARKLVDLLRVKARALERLDRDAEAIATWEEIARVAGQIIQDSELYAFALATLSSRFRALDMHDDAVRTGRLAITTYQQEAETEAQIYLFLSEDLQELRRYKESAEAAQKSVTLYRHPAMRDPETWTGYLTDGLSNLALCLAASGDYSEALIVWTESVSMLDNFLNTDTEEEEEEEILYLAALRNHLLISNILEDKESLKVSATAILHLRQLSEFYPQNADMYQDLLQAECCHAYNMLRVGHLQDGQQYVDQWHDIWSNKPEAIPESEIERWRAAMTTLKADILDAQGCTKQALLVTQKVYNIVKLSVTTSQRAFIEVIKSMVQEARLRVSLGDSKKAMQVAEEALLLDKKLGKDAIISAVWSLSGVALAASSCRNYTRAVETAKEGCILLTSPEGLKFAQNSEHNAFIRPTLLAILSSAEANLGKSSTTLEYAHRAVQESLDIRDRKLEISATTAEQSYMETRGNLAEILLATGDLNQARQICEERSAYFFKRVEKRIGDYRELAPILRMLGVLCCSEGHHDEGNTAAQELSRIMKTLGSAFPSLQEQVKIRLRRQAKVPILKVIDDLSKKLDCGHQAEILSLFEI